ncbi:NAD(P)-dependent dehydrogenase (short-subunit alcohol dehydrogenase family) [Phyllobacterium ifriqiyense]|uniref:NAD(P)-dependent dehydrogenase (Short-subunit alcohol dehydrogenase family) n=1 Tax=Phyllobacterium ifriqiyense TaxID=314238 RepID=A0ABU0SD71_9HYPH|nr:SDR family oxidoreductase [Phyllobacterium ifriqiyense]MDQ0998709.1 NAD(P)-dependent dehydrogenase (short-subunit alcohol dehydrogenase family) [Phyllobacterium ifriqiyense]
MKEKTVTLDRPIALVTGGAKRIGKAIVEDLAGHGFAVAIHSNHSRAEGEALLAAIESKGGKGCVVEADLTDSDATRRLVSQVQHELGPVQLLVNNASVFQEDAIGNLADDVVWNNHFAVHVKAPVLLADAVASLLPDGQDGLIVNIIDQRVWKLTPKFLSYTLSKSALWTATQTLAQALAPRLRVNAIGPGPTMPSDRQDQHDFNQQVSSLLLERGPDLSEFGRTIRYLWETRSITGQMIALDGGQHLAWKTADATGIAE